MDGRDQEMVDRCFDDVQRTIRGCARRQELLLLAILNQLRKERGEMELKLDDVAAK